MFTGLVEAVGTIREVCPEGGVTRIGIVSDLPGEPMSEGESVSVDGVCLTVTRLSGHCFYADVVPETLSRTNLGRMRPEGRVNLERSLRLGDRLGGHLLQGHVDSVARVRRVQMLEGDCRLHMALEPAISRFVAEKGSIGLSGVSLTVASLSGDTFEVALIPETLSRTNLGEVRPDDLLNVEVDLLARYLDRLMVGRDQAPTESRPEEGRNRKAGDG